MCVCASARCEQGCVRVQPLPQTNARGSATTSRQRRTLRGEGDRTERRTTRCEVSTHARRVPPPAASMRAEQSHVRARALCVLMYSPFHAAQLKRELEAKLHEAALIQVELAALDEAPATSAPGLAGSDLPGLGAPAAAPAVDGPSERRGDVAEVEPIADHEPRRPSELPK